ncbi:MAG TPA: ribosome biogenesis GTPase Der [Gammaproteobacteria bacterium]|nr:ribosome biogenesis GTPase Der [Gammaproteobacteria bacterium]|tara:strand:+ start:1292 stop:2692 length:1401 start_codon:yes stop_codon:yes gene_type:complete
MLPIVAIVGRPNVGKSTLFNQLTGTSAALVADIEGLTRDRIYGHIQSEKNDLIVIDTGGLDFDHGDLSQTIQEQTETAIEEADLVCFVVDGREGLSNSDREVALDLRKKDKETILVVNKVEGMSSEGLEADFHSLGFKEMVSISAKRGDNCADLIGLIEQKIDQPDIDSTARELDENEMSIALIGRPNVGKSTFINSFIKEERVLTQNRPGTTRDSIFIDFNYRDIPLVLIDTAGIRRKKKVNETIEKFSVVKALQAIDLSDSVIVIIDALEGITDQDLSLIGLVINSGRAFCIAMNKYDLLDDEQKEYLDRQIKRRLKFASFIETVEISALKSIQLEKTIDTAIESAKSSIQDVPTSKISALIEKLTETKPPPYVQGRRIKLKYATQVNHQPPTFIIYGTQTSKLRDNYKRFLESQIRKAFQFKGTPIKLIFKDGDNPFAGKRNKLTTRQWKKRRRIIRIRKKKK